MHANASQRHGALTPTARAAGPRAALATRRRRIMRRLSQ